MNPVSRAVDKPQAQAGSEQLLALLHAGFVLTGVVSTVLGPMLPVLSAGIIERPAQAERRYHAQHPARGEECRPAQRHEPQAE